MKRRSFALSASVALLSMVITGCANFHSGDSSNGELPTSSIAIEATESTMVVTDVVSTTICITTTTTVPTTTTTAPATTAETTTTTIPTTTTETTTTTSTTMEVTTTTAIVVTEPTTIATEAPQPQVTTIVTTAEPVVTTAAPVIPVTPASGFQELPSPLMDIVNKYKKKYPNMSIGVGIYSLYGGNGYEYNAYQLFNGACTIKAAYALYVCDYCDKNGIDITTEKLLYTSAHHHGGSGVIHDWGYNKWYTIEDLLTYLLGVSDNDAMKLLISKFPMSGFYEFISPLGGENDWANWNGGRASVNQRRNEWIAIYNYINSDAGNASKLRSFLTNTQYCYIVKGMQYVPTYMHKSGWCDSYSYPAACDAAIIQNRNGSYLVVIMTQDYSTGNGHTDAIAELGNAIDDYYYNPKFFWMQ